MKVRSLAVAALFSVSLNAQLQLISRPAPSKEAIERGQKEFTATCGFCHGASARGGESGPDLVRSPIVLDDEDGDKVGPVIRSGRPDKGMPSFDLTAEQISDIAAFLRDRTQAAINRNAYPILNLLTGDAKKGEAYFNSTGKCNTCHSPSGDLAGVGSKYDPIALQSRFLYPGGNIPNGPRPKPRTATVTPSSGPAVSGTLEYIDDFTIGVRDADGNYHSWPRESVKATIKDPYAAHADLLRVYTDADMHNLLAYLVTLK